MPKTLKRKCFFFDRDGIVNKSPGPGRYVTRWSDFHLNPGFVPCLRRTFEAGYQAVIVTNQRCVARGLISIASLEAIHGRLKLLLRKKYGLKLLDIAYCPHDNGECNCRKPEPGMLLAMAKKHGLDLGESWMVGDSDTDIEAGRRAGCRTILVGRKSVHPGVDCRVSSMRVLARKIGKLI